MPPGNRYSGTSAQIVYGASQTRKADVGSVVVECEQSMSRSLAVAAAICKALGGNDSKFWLEYQPNEYVYRLVLEAHRNKTGDDEADDRPVGR